MAKKKLSEETKVKLIYCGELAIIALIVIVIGALKLAGVIGTKPTRLLVYNIITTLGGVWVIVDLIWAIVSKKRRAKVCMMDKLMTLPVGLYLLVFDTICFIHKAQGLEPNDLLVKLSVGIVLLYIGVIYIFQAIFHYFHPVPQMLEAIEEAKQAKLEEEQKALENPEKEEEKIEEENEKA